ncbi:hypothetical protein [Spongiactinospora sp. TRM90649]|uniref:hypothetical protein n=1 Tax=Spongiactinospora sp. TRM90649 TaxID=3031114 RepID=UPI0023F7ABA3|nr:hypothetical protein [Spongiactinospora sp. TRM90649]MDF5752480.1 hypothetical protein [Spongiactinospora sp. TRM90649]
MLAAQAGQILNRKRPEEVGDSLAGIEAVGSEALAATRRMVGLLREPGGEAPPVAPADRQGGGGGCGPSPGAGRTRRSPQGCSSH